MESEIVLCGGDRPVRGPINYARARRTARNILFAPHFIHIFVVGHRAASNYTWLVECFRRISSERFPLF